MFNGKLNSYNIHTGEVDHITLQGNLTLAIPSEFDTTEFVVGLDKRVLKIQWNAQQSFDVVRVVSTVDEDKPRNRLNDGKADRNGRLWVGMLYEEIFVYLII